MANLPAQTSSSRSVQPSSSWTSSHLNKNKNSPYQSNFLPN